MTYGPRETWRGRALGPIHVKDEVLVPIGQYPGQVGAAWCKVTGIAAGTASTYPIKVAMPGDQPGQFKFEEVQELRTPEWVRETHDSLRRAGLVE